MKTSTEAKAQIDVQLRIRPLLQTEINISTFQTVQKMDNHNLMIRTKNFASLKSEIKQLSMNEVYTHSNIYDHKDNNWVIFNQKFERMIPNCFEGLNHTFIFYGGENTGKTYSLLGNAKENGILLFFLYELFDYIEKNDLSQTSTISLSSYEYSKNGFKDLLSYCEYILLPNEFFHQQRILGLSSYLVQSTIEAFKIVKIAINNSVGRKFEVDEEKMIGEKTYLFFEIMINSKKRRKSNQVEDFVTRVCFIDFAGIYEQREFKNDKISLSLKFFTQLFGPPKDELIKDLEKKKQKNHNDFLFHINNLMKDSFVSILVTLSPFMEHIETAKLTLEFSNNFKKYLTFPIIKKIDIESNKQIIKKSFQILRDNSNNLIRSFSINDVEKDNSRMEFFQEIMRKIKLNLERFSDIMTSLEKIESISKKIKSISNPFIKKQMNFYDASLTDVKLKTFYFSKRNKIMINSKTIEDDLKKWSRKLKKHLPLCYQIYQDYRTKIIEIKQCIWEFQNPLKGASQLENEELLYAYKIISESSLINNNIIHLLENGGAEFETYKNNINDILIIFQNEPLAQKISYYEVKKKLEARRMKLTPKIKSNFNLFDLSLNKQNYKPQATIHMKDQNDNSKSAEKSQTLFNISNNKQQTIYNNYKRCRKANSSVFFSDKFLDKEKEPSLNSFKFLNNEENKSTFENLIEDNFKNKNVIQKINFQPVIPKRSFSKPNDRNLNIKSGTLNFKEYMSFNAPAKPASDGLFKRIFKRNEANFRERILPLINMNKNFNLNLKN